MTYVIAVLMIGFAAGLRTATPLAALAWAGAWGWIDLDDSWLASLSMGYLPWVLALVALWEIVIDKLPSTRSRKVPLQFATRVGCGAVAGSTGTGWRRIMVCRHHPWRSGRRNGNPRGF